MKKILLSISLSVCGLLTFAQTNPTPQIVPATGSYTQDFSSLTGRSTTYPDGFQGWRINTAPPNSAGRTSEPRADIGLSPNGSGKTSSSGVYDFNGKIGIFSNAGNDYAVVLALNTSEVPADKRVEVKFDTRVMRNLYNGQSNNYIQGLSFMYRVGTSGAFTLVDNNFINNGDAPTNTAGTDGVNVQSVSFTLPADASNEPVVQVRWILRTLSGTAPSKGSDRPSFAIDNIVVQAVD